MADLAQLEAALVKADAAGDTEGARVLAGEVRKMRSSAPAIDVSSAKIQPRDYDAELMKGNRMDQVPYEAGARVNDWLAAKGAPSPMAAGLGSATNAGLEGVQMMIGGGVGKLAEPAFQAAGRNVMQRALKPGINDALQGKGDRAVQTLLDEGVNVSRGGVEKLRTIGEELNRKAAGEIAGSTANVDKNAVASRLLDTEKKFQAQVNPQGDLNAIQNVWTDFVQHPQLAGQPTMPIQLAQELKQGTYKQLRDKYGEMGSAATEAQKALAMGLKEEIEKGAPTIIPINRRASDIWNALNVTERRALQQGNKDLTGIAMLAHNPGAAAGMALDRSSLAKSLLARALYSGKIPQATGAMVPLAIQQAQDEQR